MQRIEQVRRGEMLYRRFGNTGIEISVIGLGGSHFAKTGDEAGSIRLVRSAIDRGITFMDNSWDYGAGQSEIWMGKALKDGYRDKVFLMSKIDGRTKPAAAKQIDESLLRLQVDHVDLMQFHELVYLHDPDMIFSEDGAVVAMEAAVRAGKVRHVGFTGHKDPFIHLRMLEMGMQHGYHFHAVQMSLNVMDAHFRSFEKQVVPAVLKTGGACLGMKSLAGGKIAQCQAVTPVECIQYVLNLPVATLIVGIDSVERLDQACTAVGTFDFWSTDRIDNLLGRTREYAMSGQYEPFKTTPTFDSTQKNPDWLGI